MQKTVKFKNSLSHTKTICGVLVYGRLASIQLTMLPFSDTLLMIKLLPTCCADCLTFKMKFY